MARKSNVQIAGESALRNLQAIYEIASDGGKHATYVRNAGDCERWCLALRAAGIAYPAFMVQGGIKYFTAIWHLPKEMVK